MIHLKALRKGEEGKSPITISEIIEEKIADIEEKNSMKAKVAQSVPFKNTIIVEEKYWEELLVQ